MAATPKKGVLVPVNDERKHGAAAPAALAQKLASPAKAASKEALRERMEAAAVRRDIELEQRQFRAHNSAIPKGEVAAPGAVLGRRLAFNLTDATQAVGVRCAAAAAGGGGGGGNGCGCCCCCRCRLCC